MFGGGFRIGYFDLTYGLAKLVLHRNRQPNRTLARFDLIAVLQTILTELDHVKVNEYISRHYFVHIRWPGKILGLVNGDLHVIRAIELTW